MSQVPTLRTLRLTLRGWNESDIEPLTRILMEPEVVRYLSTGGRPVGPAEAREAYGRRVATWDGDGIGFFAVQLNATGELIGWAGLQKARSQQGLEDDVEVGWMLGRPWWGCGYAREAAEASLRWAFGDLGLERVYAFHAPANRRSERLMESLGMEPAGEAVDIRDGAVSLVRVMTRQGWGDRPGAPRIPNPHTDGAVLSRVLGYECETCSAALSKLEADEMREALLAAIARTWPGGALPGEPCAYRVDDGIGDIATEMMTDRMAGLVPLLVSVDIREPEDAGDRLAELYVATLREGVWLHADIVARHGLYLEGLARADSIAFQVPGSSGPCRVFATRHPDMLDASFADALGIHGGAGGIR